MLQICNSPRFRGNKYTFHSSRHFKDVIFRFSRYFFFFFFKRQKNIIIVESLRKNGRFRRKRHFETNVVIIL